LFTTPRTISPGMGLNSRSREPFSCVVTAVVTPVVPPVSSEPLMASVGRSSLDTKVMDHDAPVSTCTTDAHGSFASTTTLNTADTGNAHERQEHVRRQSATR
jgi:hypothetical protein